MTNDCPLILAIDTSLGACSVCLWKDGHTLAEKSVETEYGHAQILVGLVQQALEIACLHFKDIDAIGVTCGPGSFTGVRVGLAAATGFGMALSKPVIGITTFDAIAASVQPTNLAVAIDPHRDDSFVQLYKADGSKNGEPFSITPGEEQRLIPTSGDISIAGNAAERIVSALAENEYIGRVKLVDIKTPTASAIASLTAARLPQATLYPAHPFYFREPDVKKMAGETKT